MAIKFTTTKDQSTHAKVLVHGESGTGKTTLAGTCPNPLIISSEKKLISLQDKNIPVVIIEDHNDLKEILEKIKTGKKFEKFESIVIDSISDIAETLLSYFKENPENGNTHPQAAYGMLADTLMPIIKGFRDIPNKHLYVIAKTKRMVDEYSGLTQWGPMLPGQQIAPNLPYMFDYVFASRIGEREDKKTGKLKKFYYLQTEGDIQWLAKGTDKLRSMEKSHLGEIFNKILISRETKETKATKEEKDEAPE